MHECKQEDNIVKLFNKLDYIKDRVAEGATQSALTNQLLKGNGVPGICQRLTDAEAKIIIFEKYKNENQAVKKDRVWMATAIVSIFAFIIESSLWYLSIKGS